MTNDLLHLTTITPRIQLRRMKKEVEDKSPTSSNFSRYRQDPVIDWTTPSLLDRPQNLAGQTQESLDKELFQARQGGLKEEFVTDLAPFSRK